MLSPEHPWNDLVEEADEDPITAAASVSAPQAERHPPAAGFDVTSERERANAVIARWNLGQPNWSTIRVFSKQIVSIITRMARVRPVAKPVVVVVVVVNVERGPGT